MSDCEKYMDLLSACVDGELTEAENAELKEHLNACAECRELLEAMRFASGQTTLTAVEPPETLKADIMKKIKKPDRPKLHILRYAALAAMLAIVIFAAGRAFPRPGTIGVTAGPRAIETPTAASLQTTFEKLKSEIESEKKYAAAALISGELPEAASSWKLVKETEKAEYFELPVKEFKEKIVFLCSETEWLDTALSAVIVIYAK